MKVSPQISNIAVVGVGAFGAAHAKCPLALGQAYLCGFLKAGCGRRKALFEEFPGVLVYASQEGLLENEPVDGLIIATRPAPHVPLAIQALDSGLSVLIEKPAGSSEKELTSLCNSKKNVREM